MIGVQTIPTGLLVQEYRETLMALGRNPADVTLSRRADLLEEELLRRAAW